MGRWRRRRGQRRDWGEVSTRLEGGGQLGIRAPEPVVVGARGSRGADQGERPRSGAFGAGGMRSAAQRRALPRTFC